MCVCVCVCVREREREYVCSVSKHSTNFSVEVAEDGVAAIVCVVCHLCVYVRAHARVCVCVFFFTGVTVSIICVHSASRQQTLSWR